MYLFSVTKLKKYNLRVFEVLHSVAYTVSVQLSRIMYLRSGYTGDSSAQVSGAAVGDVTSTGQRPPDTIATVNSFANRTDLHRSCNIKTKLKY